MVLEKASGNDHQTTRLMIFRLGWSNDSCFFNNLSFFLILPSYLLYVILIIFNISDAYPFLEEMQNQVLRSNFVNDE